MQCRIRQLLLFFCSVVWLPAHTQVSPVDAFVDLGGYELHFRILEGDGTPILFESGAGYGADVWDPLMEPLYNVTGTTLISYSRAGFGKSGIDPSITADADHNILNGVIALEKALFHLGYEDLILVCHSYGGFYTTLFANRNPESVKFMVRFDANLVEHYTDEVLEKASRMIPDKEESQDDLGRYYLGYNFADGVRFMRNIEYPSSIPTIDIVSPHRRHQTEDEWDLQMWSHENLVSIIDQGELIYAHGSGHAMFLDNPPLALNAITKAFLSTVKDEKTKLAILEDLIDENIALAVDLKKSSYEARKSPDNLNSLGYIYLKEGHIEEALTIFKVNIDLYPQVANGYDSYGDALRAKGDLDGAREMYRKAIEIDPKMESSVMKLRVLDRLGK